MDQPPSRPSDVMVTQTLRRSRMFADLPAEQLQPIVSNSQLVKVAKNSFLFHEGQRAEGLYIVHRGAINVHRTTAEGKEQVIRVFYPGESFAEVVMVGEGTYPASAVASQDSQVILIPRAFFRQQVSRDPELALRILVSMSLHLKFLVETVEDLKLRHAQSRLIQWIIRQAESVEPGPTPGLTIVLPTSKRLLASQLGITSETFSRVLAILRDRDCIRVKGKTIEILSIATMRKLLDTSE